MTEVIEQHLIKQDHIGVITANIDSRKWHAPHYLIKP